MRPLNVKNRPTMNEERDRRFKEFITIRDDIKVPERLMKSVFGKAYFIRTYGCQANVRDEETMAGLLALAGFTKADDETQADLVIVNTCAVRENAEDKVFGEIGLLKSLKEKRPSMIVAVAGCMIQQAQVVEAIENKYKYVDLVFGTHNIHELLDLLDEVLATKSRLIDVRSRSNAVVENLPCVRGDRFKAFVNIMYGCDKFCTYCIVPYTRGKERSRQSADILDECRHLVQDGYQEITLLGQNVNAYGKDLNDGGSFAKLLQDVAETGIPRLRFMTSHPWDFSDAMIDIIATHKNIMPAIHLPFQSGNDTILKNMGRRYTCQGYRDLVDRMKAKIPELALTTDIIVGFPNETDDQFADTIAMVKYVGFDGCFTFIYSPRFGTPAAKLTDNVTSEEKHRRFSTLLKVVEEEGEKKANAMVGKTFAVLVEGVSKKNDQVLSGYTETGKLVHFSGDETLIGKIVFVRINESHLYSMLGELTHE
jgi:tRNA-2-methylthio-N6-dimethylallyladenosine synthase